MIYVIVQGIASVFVEKDRSTSDVAWREYLLAESILKELGGRRISGG